MSQRVARWCPLDEQFPPQLGILEKLAVERDPDRAVFVGDRLPAPREVDDRQPPGPSATPGSIWNCSSSGPRWAIAPVIDSNRWGKTHASRSNQSHRRCHTWIMPQLPNRRWRKRRSKMPRRWRNRTGGARSLAASGGPHVKWYQSGMEMVKGCGLGTLMPRRRYAAP